MAFNLCKDYALPQGDMIKMKELGYGVILPCQIIMSTCKFFKSTCKIIVGLSGKETKGPWPTSLI